MPEAHTAAPMTQNNSGFDSFTSNNIVSSPALWPPTVASNFRSKTDAAHRRRQRPRIAQQSNVYEPCTPSLLPAERVTPCHRARWRWRCPFRSTAARRGTICSRSCGTMRARCNPGPTRYAPGSARHSVTGDAVGVNRAAERHRQARLEVEAVQRVDDVLARDCDHVVVRKVGNRSDAGYQQN